jgi:hypothetical protein
MIGQSETLKAALGKSAGPKISVYGYGSLKNPFFKEARALNANPRGCLLILNAAVSRGEKLLLMNSSGQNPAEAEIVNTRSLTDQLFEVEVSFSAPRPDFWQQQLQ